MDTTSPTHPLLPPPASAGPSAGTWRLGRLPQARVPLLALGLSLSVHALFLLAFNGHGPRIAPPPKTKDAPVLWTWTESPDIPPPTNSDVPELKETPPVNVPRLADAPRLVDLVRDFVQPLEHNSPTTDLTNTKISTIPVDIGNERNGPGASPRIFDPSQLDRVPRAITQPAPRFPRELQDMASSAEVVVDFIVDAAGSVQGAVIVSSTHHGFERAALDGVRQWKFRPGIKGGRTVNTRIRQPLHFALEGTPGE